MVLCVFLDLCFCPWSHVSIVISPASKYLSFCDFQHWLKKELLPAAEMVKALCPPNNCLGVAQQVRPDIALIVDRDTAILAARAHKLRAAMMKVVDTERTQHQVLYVLLMMERHVILSRKRVIYPRSWHVAKLYEYYVVCTRIVRTS